jgi:hypothetical protein
MKSLPTNGIAHHMPAPQAPGFRQKYSLTCLLLVVCSLTHCLGSFGIPGRGVPRTFHERVNLWTAFSATENKRLICDPPLYYLKIKDLTKC